MHRILALGLLLAAPGALHGTLALGAENTPAAAVARARADFDRAASAAQRLFAAAAANLERELAQGDVTAEAAATGYGNALAFFAGTVKRLADEAADAAAQGLAGVMAAEGDETTRGALAGDGGALDGFTDRMQGSLDRLRKGALQRTRRFAALLAERGGSRVRMTAVVPPWPFRRRAAPTPLGPRAPNDEPILLRLALATRLTDGRVIATAAGNAPPSLSGKFDLRLRGSRVVAIGSFLAAGGMPVANDGTWSVTVALGDPFAGEGVDPGNRALDFGVEPYDGGLAGMQPGRFQLAGVLGVP